jgi:predicted DNA-binding transcriptional regulator AlpA
LFGMSPKVDTEDLLDAQGVADILQLAHRNTVSQYQQRYDDMPRPAVDLGPGRVKLWLGSEIERWAEKQTATGRTRPKRRVSR